jgi:hypothetical protein
MGALCDLGADLLESSFIAAVFTVGMMMAAPRPRSGQIAPNR